MLAQAVRWYALRLGNSEADERSLPTPPTAASVKMATHGMQPNQAALGVAPRDGRCGRIVLLLRLPRLAGACCMGMGCCPHDTERHRCGEGYEASPGTPQP